MVNFEIEGMDQLWASFFTYSPVYFSHIRDFDNWYDLIGNYGGFRDLMCVLLAIPALAINKKLQNGSFIRQLYFWRNVEI